MATIWLYAWSIHKGERVSVAAGPCATLFELMAEMSGFTGEYEIVTVCNR